MKLTDQSLGEKLRITTREIARRKQLFSITEEDEVLLRQAGASLSGQEAAIIDEFYADQVSKPEIERLIGDAETLVRLKRHIPFRSGNPLPVVVYLRHLRRQVEWSSQSLTAVDT